MRPNLDPSIDLIINQLALKLGKKHYQILGECCAEAVERGLIDRAKYLSLGLPPQEFMEAVILDFRRLPLFQLKNIFDSIQIKNTPRFND